MYTSTLLRRSYREDGKVKKETVANLSHLPDGEIETIRGALAGHRDAVAGAGLEIERSLPAGHVNAVLTMARRLGLAKLIDRHPSRERDLVLAMICQRVIAPASKLGTVRAFEQSTLASELGVAGADEDDLYASMDWLYERQERIEDRLARRHLTDREGVLYDVSSSYFEGRCCECAEVGNCSSGSCKSPQVCSYRLLCDKAGRPIAVELFPGEDCDDEAPDPQITGLRERSQLSRVVVVSDRGMSTCVNLELMAGTGELGWIVVLESRAVKKLIRDRTLQLPSCDQANVTEITSKDFPGERLIVCRNPQMAADLNRQREDLFAATERDLDRIAGRIERGTLQGADQIERQVQLVLGHYKTQKFFETWITDSSFVFRRKAALIDARAALDGMYVLRTNVPSSELPARAVVRAYAGLKQAVRPFRGFKGADLGIHQIYHHREDRVRAHAFIDMLAYYLSWHLRRAWAPLLLNEATTPVRGDSAAMPARSPEALNKVTTKSSSGSKAWRGCQSLLADLSTQTLDTIRLPGSDASFSRLATPTPLQARALDLIQHANLDA